MSTNKVTHHGVAVTLEACGPLTSAEVAEFFPGSPHRDVASVLSSMRTAARKRVYISGWTHDATGQTTHPRAIYALGDQPDAPRPPKQPHKQVRARYRAKLARAKPRAPRSVFELARFL